MTLATSNTPQPYPPPEVLEYMEQQAELFEQMRSQLVEHYLNQYVWFENGQVLDADLDHATLILRAYGDKEPRPLFVRKVLPVEPRFFVRTPFQPE